MEDALQVASSPHDFKLLVAAEGRRATSMADLADAHAEDEEREELAPVPRQGPPLAAA
jgi:twitching motility protein PilT